MKVSAVLPTAESGVPDVDAARHLEELGCDQAGVPDLVIGDGTPGLDPVAVLAAAAARTERIGLLFSVLSLPLRPVALVAAQVQALQHLSGGRTVLGVGIGGFPGSPFWRALDAPVRRRGRAADAALDALPGLIRGDTTDLDGEQVTLAPGAAVPPILIGGNSEAAMRRAVRYGDGWFPSLVTPEDLAAKARRLREIAEESGRPVPGISVGGHGMLDTGGDQGVYDAAVRSFVDSASQTHGIPRQVAARLPVTGGPEQVAERLAAYADAGARSLSLSLDGDAWHRQAEVLADARARLAKGG